MADTITLIDPAKDSGPVTKQTKIELAFLVKTALGSALLYIVLFNTPVYLNAHYSLMPSLLDFTRYFDLRVALADLGAKGLNLDFTRSYPFNFALFVVAATGLFWLYYRAFRFCQQKTVPLKWVFGLTAGIGILLVIQPYIFSSDVFSYTIYGRILGIYHQNPLKVPVETFSQDPIYNFLSWRYGFTIYGPAWTLLSAAFSWAWSDNAGLQVLLYRLLALVFHLLSGLVIWQIVRARARANERQAAPNAAPLIFFLWNPLLLIEVSSAHNDLFMLFFVLVGLWWFCARPQPRLAGGMAVMLGVLVKILAVPYLPSFIILLTRQQKGWARKLITFGSACLVLLAMLALFYLPFTAGTNFVESQTSKPLAVAMVGTQPATSILFEEAPPKNAFDNLLSFINSESQYLNSPAMALHSALSKFLTPLSGSQDKASELSNLLVRNGLRAVFVILLLWEFWITRSPADLRASLLRISFYSVFLLYTWFWPWYLVPLVGFAALNAWNAWTKTALLFSFTIMLEYAFVPLNDFKTSSQFLYTFYQWRTVFTFGIPLAFLLWNLYRDYRHKRTPGPVFEPEPSQEVGFSNL